MTCRHSRRTAGCAALIAMAGWVAAFGGTLTSPFKKDADTILLLHFDEQQGAIAKDASDLGLDFRFDSNKARVPKWSREGLFGGAIALDGENADKDGDKQGDADAVLCRAAGKLAPSPHLTVELWIRPARIADRPSQSLFNRSGGRGRYNLFIEGSALFFNLSVVKDGKPGWAYCHSPKGVVVADLWQHVAVTYDGAFLRLYHNGREMDKTPVKGKVFMGGGPGVTTIGRDGDVRPFKGIRGFKGLIDEVRVSKVARTKFDIPPQVVKAYSAKVKKPVKPADVKKHAELLARFKNKYPDPPIPPPNPRDVTARCRVFIDVNANGKRDAGDKPFKGCLVSDSAVVIESDAKGEARFRFNTPLHRYLFAVRPRGYRPTTKFYHLVDAADKQTTYAFEIGFAKDAAADRDEFQFIVTADSQFTQPWQMMELRAEFRQMSELTPPAAFHMICGDLTMNGTWYEMNMYHQISQASKIRVYSVYGNHDAPKSKTRGRRADNFFRGIGPVWYSWNYGPVHFIGFNGMDECMSKEMFALQAKWLDADLAKVPKGTPIVLGTHIPPVTKVIDRWLDAGHNIAAVFYGHWHQQGEFTHRGVPFVLTGPIRGRDWGMFTRHFRAARFKDGRITTTMRVCGQTERLEVASPAGRVRRGSLPIVVMAYDTARPVTRVTCEMRGPSGVLQVALKSMGEWTFRGDADLSKLGVGKCTVLAKATSADGKTWSEKAEFEVVPGDPAVVKTDRDWPGIFFNNEVYRTVEGKLGAPLQVAWVAHTDGANMQAPSPLVYRGRVYLGLQRTDAHSPGVGVVCFDAATGKRVWKRPTDSSVRFSMLVHEAKLYAISGMGTVYCLDPADGKAHWTQSVYSDGKPGRGHTLCHSGLTPGSEGLIAIRDGGLAGRATVAILDWRSGKLKKKFRARTSYYGFPIERDGVIYCAGRRYTHAFDLATLK